MKLTFIERTLLGDLKTWIDRREILAVKGPRQSGKTTLLKKLAEWLRDEKGVDEAHVVYVTLEDREQLDDMSQNSKDFVRRRLVDGGRHYLLLDEAQYLPEPGKSLKLVYDLFDNVKMVVTGSSSLELKRQTGKFLVGRMLEFELLPLSFFEFLRYKDRGLSRMYAEWNGRVVSLLTEGTRLDVKEAEDVFTRDLLVHLNEYSKFGGYPAVVLAREEEEKKKLLKGLISTYMDRDIVSFLQITDTIKFRNLMTALAATAGSMVKVDQLANEVGSYFKELTWLLDVLEQTYVIRRVRPFHRNLVTELKKAPKAYFVDAGLRNSLVDNFADLGRRADGGAMVEGFVANQLSSHVRTGYWRTTAKTEVDFVAHGRTVIPVEVKFQRFKRPEVSRSLGGFLRSYHPDRCLVVTRDFWGRRKVGETEVAYVPVGYL